MIPQPPDWLLRWCLLYLRHVGPWLIWGLVVAHVLLYVVLQIQRRTPETPPAAALRQFVGSKAPFWLLLALLPSGGGRVPSPWWIVAETVVVTLVTFTTYRLLILCGWYYVVRPLRGVDAPPPLEEVVLPDPEEWSGEERRVGPPDRRRTPKVGA